MIVLDEQLNEARILTAIARWYPGAVVALKELLPNPLQMLNDPEIPRLLRRQNRPTFITINWADFWFEDWTDERYCILCFKLDQHRKYELPALTRAILKSPSYNTKAKRMGKMLLWRDDGKVLEKS
jgi:hypothetical protein